MPPDPAPRRRRNLRRALLIAGAAAAVVALTSAAVGAYLLRPKAITIIDNGAAQQRETHALTVGQALQEVGIRIGPRDLLAPAADTPLNDGDIVRIDRPRPVRLIIDGAEQALSSAYSQPRDILAENGVQLAPEDQIRVNGVPAAWSELGRWTEPVDEIVIEQRLAFTVSIEEAGEAPVTFRGASPAGTIGDALYNAGVTLYLADLVTPPLDAPLSAGLAIRIERALPITLVLDGGSLTVRTRGSTVADLLNDADVLLFGQDYTRPGLNAPLQPGMLVEIVRVKEMLETTVVNTPPNTVYTTDPTLPAGSSESIRDGRDGLEIIVTRVRYENGVETGRTEIRRIAIAPLDQVIGVGAGAP